MRSVLVVMYVLSAVLPVVGFARLLFRAQRDLDAARAKIAQRGGATSATFGDLNDTVSDISAEPRRLRADLLWDIGLVGAGLALGAAAGIWSLFTG